MVTYGMGRVPSPKDERDWPVSKLLAMMHEGAVEPVAWEVPPNLPLWQGQYPHCVGFAWSGFKACAQADAPVDESISNDEGHRIYHECKKIDGYSQEGTYIRAGAQVLKNEGTIDAYAFGSFDEAEYWCRTYGPVVMGTYWYEGMTKPVKGVVHITGDVEGGHAWLRIGDKQAPADNMGLNSWGRDWGLEGRFYISDSELKGLMLSQGEACMAVRYVKHWSDWPNEFLPDQHMVWKKGLMQGYPDGTFRPWSNLQRRHVYLICKRLGIASPPWGEDYLLATRRDVADNIPGLPWKEERWDEKITRLQFALLLARRA